MKWWWHEKQKAMPIEVVLEQEPQLELEVR